MSAPHFALELRAYQTTAIAGVRDRLRRDRLPMILCLPTGAGKTVLASFLLNECLAKGRSAVFVVDRITLIDQTSATLERYGIPHGVIQGSHFRFRPYEKIQIASAQTLVRRGFPEADLIIIDECHTVQKVVRDRIEQGNATIIGLTATPFSKGLKKVYPGGVFSVISLDELIAQGFLSKFRIYAPSEPDMTGVKVVGGEWAEAEAGKRMLAVTGDLVAEYLKHAAGRKFLVSACDVAHSEEIARQFAQAGIRIEVYSYRTSDEERRRIIDEFRQGDSRIRGLVSPVALTKGFDVPDVTCLIIARPLRRSLAEFIQFFGRGLRIHPGKVDCIILDHTGNTQRFEQQWTEFFATGDVDLNDGKPQERRKKAKSDGEALLKCPQCKHLHRALPTCPSCGFSYPPRQSIQHVPGTLAEMLGAGNRSQLSREVWPQICSYAREKRHGDAARKMALALYKQMTGGWPKTEFADTASVPITPEVAGKIRSLQIAYAKSQQAAKQAIARASVQETTQ